MNIDQHFRPKSPREWTTKKSLRIASAAVLLFAAVGVRGYLSVAPEKQYDQTNLVSDVPGVALTVDSSLVNPWGMALAPSGPWWVADSGKGISTLYSGRGGARPFRVAQTGSLMSTDAASACHVMVSGTRSRYECGAYKAVTVRQDGGCPGSHYLLSRSSRPPSFRSSFSIVGSSLT
jgi:hypothetical protein